MKEQTLWDKRLVFGSMYIFKEEDIKESLIDFNNSISAINKCGEELLPDIIERELIRCFGKELLGIEKCRMCGKETNKRCRVIHPDTNIEDYYYYCGCENKKVNK